LKLANNDTTVEAPHKVRHVRGTIAQVQPATRDIVRLRIAVDGAPFGFAPGQYAELRFENLPSRPYYMANEPGDPLLEFHIRHVPGGTVSERVARDVQAGMRVRLTGPYGSAFLRKPAAAPMLLVAGGSGLAPIKSILLSALAHEARGRIFLYHGVRDVLDLYDTETIGRVNAGAVRYIPVLSSPSLPSHHREGFLHEAIERDFDTLAGFKVYLAGPPPMVDACTATVLRLGTRAEDLYTHAFHAQDELSAREEPPAGREGFFRGLMRGRRAA
jgi:NAD(P)H-flavin reductase